MRKIGRYVLLSRIASGTLGDVFLARRDDDAEPEGEASIAIKLMRAELARDLRFGRVLFAEAPAAVRFQHPNAVRVLEVDRDGGEIYVAMELERGQPLSAVLKRAQLANEPLEHRLVCAIGARIASVLAQAHEIPWFSGAPAGMVHGGIAPRGVLITYEGKTKVLGVGIGRARLAAPASSARLPYIAPELLQDKEPTVRSDVYSLGVLLHDALSGKHVFRRATDEETRAAIREARVAPLNPLSLRVNPAIGELIQRMIVPKPDARFADLQEIERQLDEAASFAGNAEEDASIALERRMRAIFAGEMRAERRVVSAATRQPRAATPAPDDPLRAAPRRATSTSAPPGDSLGAGDTLPPAGARLGAAVPGTSLWTGDLAMPSVPTERAVQDPAGAVTLSDAPLSQMMPAEPDPLQKLPRTDPSPPPEMDRHVENEAPQRIATGPVFLDGSVPAASLGLGFDEDAFAPTSPRVAATPHPAPAAFAHLLEPAARELARRADAKAVPAAPPPRPAEMTLPTDQMPAQTEPREGEGEGDGVTTTVDLAAKRRVARYQTELVLSRSAATILYRARDPNVSRAVALKVMDPEFITDPRLRREDWIATFKREARVAGRLAHPLLPAIYDAGRDGNVFFIVYELVEGEPVSAILERGEVLRPERVRSVLVDVATALDHMHERGAVHCDLRAANVVIDKQGRAHLVDYSLATESAAPEHPLLASNLLVLSPEYLSGFGYSPRSDQFALGTLLYQMLTGVRPFRGADDRELVRAIEEKSPRPPESVDPRVDPELSEIAMRLLEKDPELRYDRPRAIVERLTQGTTAHDAAPVPRPPSTGSEQDTMPALRPMKREIASGITPDIVIVDAELDPALAKRVFVARDERVEVFPDFDAAIAEIEADPPRAVVVARTSATDTRTVRRLVAGVSRDIELRVVPDLATRLMGPVLAADELAASLTAIYERASALDQPLEHGLDRGPVGAARAIARRLGAGPRAEVLAPLAMAARELASRLRLSPTSEEIATIVPAEVAMLFAEIERHATAPAGGDAPASLLAQIVATVEAYFAATTPADGRPHTSPRRAILELRQNAEARGRTEVVDALIDHLQETISALDLGTAEVESPRVLLAGIDRDAPIVRVLSAEGFFVEAVDNGHAAWERLRRETFLGAIVERSLPGRDGLSLLELCRAHPDTAEVPFLIVAGTADAELASKISRAGRAELVDPSASLDGIRAKIGRWVNGARARRTP